MRPISILLIEDNPIDAALLERELQKANFTVDLKTIDNSKDFEAALRERAWDAIFSDFNIPSFGAIEALKILKQRNLSIPFIVISGAIGEEAAIELVRSGADEFVSKANLNRLVSTLLKVVREAELKDREIKAREQTEKMIREREKMLAIVTHDLKSPLSGVKLNLEVLQRTLKTHLPSEIEQKSSEYIRRMRTSLDRAFNLISDILDFSRIEDGSFSLRPEIHDACEVIKALGEEFHAHANNKSITLDLKIPETSMTGYFDRKRISQVLANLLGNALKFTPVGGNVELGLSIAKSDFTFYIKDSGPGITTFDKPHIFKRFFQAKDLSHLGSGLGLFIAKTIVDSHGGKIWVESQEGNGATFFFSIPRKTIETHKKESALSLDSKNFKILLVDDDDCSREILEEILIEQGYQTKSAPDGKEALELVVKSPSKPDLVLVDSKMPLMGGAEFVRNLRANNPQCASIPVVLISADPLTPEDQALFDGYLMKPIEVADLSHLIHSILGPAAQSLVSVNPIQL